MPNMGDKVCLNHTSTPATSRCTTCFKPICDECIIAENDEDFCCQICLEKHKRTSENIEALERRKPSGLFKKIILLAIVSGAIYWAYNNQTKVKEMIDKGKKEISK
jgi:hypothetical protein